MIGWFVVGASVALLLAQYVTTAMYLRRLQRPALGEGVIGKPRISLIRPVCGLDPFDEETLTSSFTQDYPDYEIIFCAPTEDAPAVAVVRRLIAQFPDRDARLLIGLDPLTGNPKLNNLAKGWDAAQSDWICMTDSNLLLPPDYLTRIAASWGKRTGLVSSPAIGIRPEGLGGRLECAFLNSNQARLQFATDSVGLGFAQGKSLFWNREMLTAAGGIGALGRHLAEDVTATKIVRGQGKRVSLTRLPFAQPVGRRTVRQIWDRQLRWSRVRRDGFPAIFAGEVINGAVLGTILFGVAAAQQGWPAIATVAFLGLWYAPEVYLMRRAGWPSGVKDIAVLPLRDVMMPAIWFATFARRGIEWRGNAMDIPKP